ncbi:MAG: phage head-tail connector protein [Bacilli bacterium]
MSTILSDVKDLCGVSDDSFDNELLLHINSAFFTLDRVGVDNKELITSTTTWADVVSEEDKQRGLYQFVMLEVRLIFDPPVNSFVVTAFKERRDELLFGLSVAVDSGDREDHI